MLHTARANVELPRQRNTGWIRAQAIAMKNEITETTMESFLSEQGGHAEDFDRKVVPAVNLCYGGGWGSADCVWAAASQGFAIILIRGSGRFCDSVELWRRSIRENPDRPLNRNEQRACFAPMRCKKENELETRLAEYGCIVDALARYAGLELFDIRDDSEDAPSLLQLVLKTVSESDVIDAKSLLPLTVKFQDHECLTKLLEKIQGAGLQCDAKRRTECLQFAAYHDDAATARVLLANGWDS